MFSAIYGLQRTKVVTEILDSDQIWNELNTRMKHMKTRYPKSTNINWEFVDEIKTIAYEGFSDKFNANPGSIDMECPWRFES